ncbi:hypothetical protein M8J77_022350 [Diaphorina citri]|nr:hypothetical protein M8J77_022350 [Diaphorina citri]
MGEEDKKLKLQRGNEYNIGKAGEESTNGEGKRNEVQGKEGPMVQCRPAQDDDNEIDSATSGGEEDYENLLVDSLSAIGERLFGIPDNKSGELVSQWNPESPINPEEVGTYYEGDILHIPNMARNGLKSLSSRWPKGVVPYEIGGYFRK